MTDFYLYITTFWPKWWPVVSAFALFGIEPVVKAYWPWGAQQLDRLSARTRLRIEITILIIAVFYAGFSSWSEEHEARNKATSDYNSAIGERDEARRQRDSNISPIIDRLSGDLTAARAQIDSQQKEIDRLKAPKPARHVTAAQKEGIIRNFTPQAHLFPEIPISAPAGDGNAHAYAQEFADVFKQVRGINVPQIGMLFATSAQTPGSDIMILVKDLNKVPEIAQTFAKLLDQSGVKVRGGTLSSLEENKFVMLIGPAP